MDWNNKDRAVIPSMEFQEDPQKILVELINRISKIEAAQQALEDRLNKLESLNAVIPPVPSP